MTKRIMRKGKVYEKIQSSPMKARTRKWYPKPKSKKYRFGKKAKKEIKTLLCFFDDKTTCTPKQLRMAPTNYCSITGRKCKRLKRRRQTERRRARTRKAKPEKTESLWDKVIAFRNRINAKVSE